VDEHLSMPTRDVVEPIWRRAHASNACALPIGTAHGATHLAEPSEQGVRCGPSPKGARRWHRGEGPAPEVATPTTTSVVSREACGPVAALRQDLPTERHVSASSATQKWPSLCSWVVPLKEPQLVAAGPPAPPHPQSPQADPLPERGAPSARRTSVTPPRVTRTGTPLQPRH
jgi:hypothetical protein